VIVVDVGANDGSLSEALLCNAQVTRVVAIEPNSWECSEKLEIIKQTFPGRVEVVYAAIARENGQSSFFNADSMNGQVGSLLEINPSGNWSATFDDLSHVSQISSVRTVKTISVGSLCSELGLHAIDFLKIDTQGTDIEILDYFLAHIPVRVAVVEVEATEIPGEQHYKDSDNSLRRLVLILNNYGYKIYRMKPVSGDCTEYNVFIAKTDSDFQHVSHLLDFEKLPTFIRFWNVLGIGGKRDISVSNLQKNLVIKLLSAILHPRQSYRSFLIKLTS
jgi:FkbM family methyltransferase